VASKSLVRGKGCAREDSFSYGGMVMILAMLLVTPIGARYQNMKDLDLEQIKIPRSRFSGERLPRCQKGPGGLKENSRGW